MLFEIDAYSKWTTTLAAKNEKVAIQMVAAN
jgi:GTP cyclohydrolase III